MDRTDGGVVGWLMNQYLGTVGKTEANMSNDPNWKSAWANFDEGAKRASGQTPLLDANTPGIGLDVTQSEEDRQRMAALVAQLQGQAQTGDGSWQQALAQGTQNANASAMALGQSMPGAGYGQALRGIANNQAANNQRAVGEGNILRAQQQQNSANQLAGILGSQGGLDASQAAEQAAARQGVKEINNDLQLRANSDNAKTLSSNGNTMMSTAMAVAASDGGQVPGKPKVFGDNEANDTVPAWLSPGEVVLPRSVTNSPDAPEQAAAFVRAVQARHGGGARHFADGGDVPQDDQQWAYNDPAQAAKNAAWNDASKRVQQWTVDAGLTHGQPITTPAPVAKTDVDIGARLDPRAYNTTRTSALQNIGALEQQANGAASVAPQEMQNATDSGLANAMQAMTNARGPGAAAANNNAAAIASQANQGAAGKMGSTVMGEHQNAATAFAKALVAQRAQDLAFAQAQQQAAWRNKMMDMGMDSAQQNNLKGLFSGAGQAAVGLADAFGGENIGKGAPSYSAPPLVSAGPMASSVDEWNSFPSESRAFDTNLPENKETDWNSPSSIWNGDGAAHGGQVVDDSRAKDFVAALKRRTA